MRRHVRSWRKQTLHSSSQRVREGQRIAAIEREIDEFAYVEEALVAAAISLAGPKSRNAVGLP
jgi:hypothetical protein